MPVLEGKRASEREEINGCTQLAHCANGSMWPPALLEFNSRQLCVFAPPQMIECTCVVEIKRRNRMTLLQLRLHSLDYSGNGSKDQRVRLWWGEEVSIRVAISNLLWRRQWLSGSIWHMHKCWCLNGDALNVQRPQGRMADWGQIQIDVCGRVIQWQGTSCTKKRCKHKATDPQLNDRCTHIHSPSNWDQSVKENPLHEQRLTTPKISNGGRLA